MDARPQHEITWPSKEGAYYLRATKSITRWPFLPLQPCSVLTIEIDQNAWKNTNNKKWNQRLARCRHVQFYLNTIRNNARVVMVRILFFFFLVFIFICYTLWEVLYGCVQNENKIIDNNFGHSTLTKYFNSTTANNIFFSY